MNPIIFNPTGKKRMTVRECFEPLQFVRDYQEANQFFIDFYKFARADKVDFITGMLSRTQQTILYLENFIEKNKSEEVKALVKEHYFL